MSTCLTLTRAWLKHWVSRIIHCGRRVQEFNEWQKKNRKRSSKEAWTWEGSSPSKWSTTSTRNTSKRGQSVPVDISKRTDPEEKGLAWRDLDELDTSLECLFPDTTLPCPVVDKDPRIYCAYCDMNNHPRFRCKHVEKHRKPNERHRCTLCAGKHAAFQCPRAQVNGGPGQPNWHKQEYKRAKSENREADYRWGSMVTHVDVDGPDSTSQPQQEVPQPQCAAAAMMHGISMAPASSLHGGCPPIAEHQEYSHPMAPPGMTMMQHDVITPNPDYKIPPIYGISILRSVQELQAHCRRSFVIATRWRVLTILRTASRVFQLQQKIFWISTMAHLPLRTRGNCRSIARSSLMSQHAVVYGHEAFRRTSKMNRRRFTNGLKA